MQSGQIQFNPHDLRKEASSFGGEDDEANYKGSFAEAPKLPSFTVIGRRVGPPRWNVNFEHRRMTLMAGSATTSHQN